MQPIEAERRYSARNYDPLPVVLARGRARISGTRWPALRRHDERLFGGQPRSGHPRILAALPGRRTVSPCRRAPISMTVSDLSSLSLHPYRARRRAADEHRRGGGRDRHQGGAPLGLPRQGIARDQAEIIVRRELPRAAPRPSSHSRASAIIATVRPVHAGLPLRPFGDLSAVRAGVDDRDARRAD